MIVVAILIQIRTIEGINSPVLKSAQNNHGKRDIVIRKKGI